ncbi:MAG: phosphotransferase [Akkermansiaceae bacterium]
MKCILPEREGLARFLAGQGWNEKHAVSQLGAGNRHGVFLLECGKRRAVLKLHEPALRGRRDAFAHEVLMHSFYATESGQHVPALLAHDEISRGIFFDHVKGEAVATVEHGYIRQLARFLVESNSLHVLERARQTGVPAASDSGASVSEHWNCAVDRLDALLGSPRTDDIAADMHDFLRSELQPALDALKPSAEHAVPVCLSPSDFGFHNVVRRDDDSLCFLDFEHAGWDDPAKLVADFILQPELPLRAELVESFIESLGNAVPFGGDLRARVRSLLPIQKCKWTMIVLNVFTRPEVPPHVKAAKLVKAKRYWQSSSPCV